MPRTASGIIGQRSRAARRDHRLPERHHERGAHQIAEVRVAVHDARAKLEPHGPPTVPDCDPVTVPLHR
jgi:hypothetical protein